MLTDARGVVGTAAVTEFDLVLVEMLLKLAPLSISNRLVMFLRMLLPAPGERELVVADDRALNGGDVAAGAL